MISLLVTIALIGLVCWLLTTLIPMDVKFQQAIIAVAIVAILLYVLRHFGLLTNLG